MFESSFVEGMDGPEACKNCGYRGSLHKILTQEPFEVLYSLLYYLYTDCVYFTTAPGAEVVPLTDCRIPPCDAEEIYAIAHRFELDKLKTVALEFLVDTCDEINILSRVFGRRAEEYEELRDAYTTEFYQLWNNWIRDSSELTKFIEDLDLEIDEVRRATVSRKCWELMRGLVYKDQQLEGAQQLLQQMAAAQM